MDQDCTKKHRFELTTVSKSNYIFECVRCRMISGADKIWFRRSCSMPIAR